MDAKEIRKTLNEDKDSWNDHPLYSGTNGGMAYIMVEIAALLAEIRDELRKK